ADLLITQDEFEQLTQLRERRYYEDLARTYEAHIPAINPIDWVQSQCQLAHTHGFHTHYFKERWMRAALQYGEQFYQRHAIIQHLAQNGLTPQERWDRIEQVLTPINANQKHTGMNDA
ncbi:MAG: hypothetical protein OIF57_07305, partial [Marinobacterium sp.]|nr:hypothetical protein [Marinobacterium sp.]